MNIRQELAAALKTVAAVENRVYPLIMPQDTQMNSITYNSVDEADNTGLCGSVQYTDMIFQVDVFAKTYADSVNIRAAAETALRDHFIISQMGGYEMYEDITLKYRQILSFKINGILDKRV